MAMYKENEFVPIYIGNIPYSIVEDELLDFFKDVSPILAVNILVRKGSPDKMAGYGFIEVPAATVEKVLSKNGCALDGRKLSVSISANWKGQKGDIKWHQ
ncbi:MAG: RNA-binding protein [bacterium]|nr:RNA-binding protein [bacterium]